MKMYDDSGEKNLFLYSCLLLHDKENCRKASKKALESYIERVRC